MYNIVISEILTQGAHSALLTMELLSQDEIQYIAEQCGFANVICSTLEEFSDKIIGYLGDHLNLIIDVESNGARSKLKLFVKCMPRFDEWKAEYLRELRFFKKEYVMLNSLFKHFIHIKEGSRKWRPNLLFIKEDIFVFEDVSLQGYKMPHHQDIMAYEELKASIETMARFHAQSYVFEEKKSLELQRPYRIWEDYSEYLQEPHQGKDWRDTGMRACIDYLKVFSKYKLKPDFITYVEVYVPILFQQSMKLMKPSTKYRNAVVHRDLWTNNILIKKYNNSECHALFVDYQTVLYCSPMLDLSSLIYFNTTKKGRKEWTDEFLDLYYITLTIELAAEELDVRDIFVKTNLKEAYEDSLVFAMTQAALITPIVCMDKDKREEIFCDPESSRRANVVSRSKEFIEIANEDDKYRIQVSELFDEILEKFVFPKDN